MGSWLDSIIGGGSTGPTSTQQTQFMSMTPAQQGWFASHGLNPTAMSQMQLALAVNQMNTDLAAQEDAANKSKISADQDAARKAAQDAESARLAAEQQAQQAAQQKALQDAAQAAETERQRIEQQNAVRVTDRDPPLPQPSDPPINIDPNPQPSPNPQPPSGFTQTDVDRMIAEAEANRVASENAAGVQRRSLSREAAQGGARVGAERYFTTRGADAAPYANDIDAAISAALGNVPATEENPLNKIDVTGIASSIFGNAESARRSGLTTQLSQLFPETYTNTRITNTLDDDILNTILNEQRGGANAVVDNMLKRRVITGSGANAAYGDLDRQSNIARGRLNTIGDDLLASGRTSIGDVIGRANTTASTVPLGGKFDPNAYVSEVDNVFNDFVKNLDPTLRARAPGSLFTTSGLGAIAGSAQGAQNTRFDPNALAGVLENQSTNTTGTPTRSSRVTDFVF